MPNRVKETKCQTHDSSCSKEIVWVTQSWAWECSDWGYDSYSPALTMALAPSTGLK